MRHPHWLVISLQSSVRLFHQKRPLVAKVSRQGEAWGDLGEHNAVIGADLVTTHQYKVGSTYRDEKNPVTQVFSAFYIGYNSIYNDRFGAHLSTGHMKNINYFSSRTASFHLRIMFFVHQS